MKIVDLPSADSGDRWDAFVESSPDCCHYHLSGWRSVIQQTYGNTCTYLAAVDNDCIEGILPLALVAGFPSVSHLASLPYLSYAGLVARTRAAAEALLAEAEARRKGLGARYVELHNLTDPRSANDGPAPLVTGKNLKALATDLGKVRMVLPLPDGADRLWKTLDAKVRNQVRKATKSGLRIEIGGSEFLAAFYKVFAENMRDLGSPVHKLDLFEKAFATFPNNLKCFMVFKDDTPVGGAVYLVYKGLAEVPWASSRRDHFQYCPNNLLYWEILKHSCDLGLSEFDFGRSSKDSGTFRFKEQWGAQPKPLYWQYVLPVNTSAPDPSHSGVASNLMMRMWQRLPLPIANTLGPRIRGRISA